MQTFGRADRAGDVPLREYALAVCLDAWKPLDEVVRRWRRSAPWQRVAFRGFALKIGYCARRRGGRYVPRTRRSLGSVA